MRDHAKAYEYIFDNDNKMKQPRQQERDDGGNLFQENNSMIHEPLDNDHWISLAQQIHEQHDQEKIQIANGIAECQGQESTLHGRIAGNFGRMIANFGRSSLADATNDRHLFAGDNLDHAIE
jgi:hypothetical protein